MFYFRRKIANKAIAEEATSVSKQEGHFIFL
jgi:hypothetical protein